MNRCGSPLVQAWLLQHWLLQHRQYWQGIQGQSMAVGHSSTETTACRAEEETKQAEWCAFGSIGQRGEGRLSGDGVVYRSAPRRRSSADDNNRVDNNNASTPFKLQSNLPSLRFDLLANECMTWLHTGKVAAVPKHATGHIAKVTSHHSCRDSVFKNWCSTSCTETGWQPGMTPARGTPLRDLAAHVPE